MSRKPKWYEEGRDDRIAADQLVDCYVCGEPTGNAQGACYECQCSAHQPGTSDDMDREVAS